MNHLPFLFWLAVILASNACTFILMLCRKAPIDPCCFACPLLRAAKQAVWFPRSQVRHEDLAKAVNTIIDQE